MYWGHSIKLPFVRGLRLGVNGDPLNHGSCMLTRVHSYKTRGLKRPVTLADRNPRRGVIAKADDARFAIAV